MGKRKATEADDRMLIIIHDPFGPPGKHMSSASESGKWDMIKWIESMFGEDTVMEFYCVRGENKVIVWLAIEDEEAVFPFLGLHHWKSFFPEVNEKVTNPRSMIFLVDHDQFYYVKGNWHNHMPKNPTPPRNYKPIAFKTPYPVEEVEYTQPPQSDSLSKAMTKPDGWEEKDQQMHEDIKLVDINLPQSSASVTDLESSVAEGWRNTPAPNRQADVAMEMSGSMVAQPHAGLWGIGSSNSQSPSTWGKTAQQGDESGRPRTTTNDSDRNGMQSPANAGLQETQPASAGPIFIVIFNYPGRNPSNPLDLSGVIQWLESAAVYGAGSVQKFWGRVLDTRLIVELSLTLSLDSAMHHVGIHGWRSCFLKSDSEEHWRWWDYGRGEQDQQSQLFMLRRCLWNERFMRDEGFEPLPLTPGTRSEPQVKIRVLPPDAYPSPSRTEAPDYHEDEVYKGILVLAEALEVTFPKSPDSVS